MQMPEPQAEHRWLQRLVGEWTCEVEGVMGPDQPPEKSTGTESVRSLGGLWTLGEGRSVMPDGGAMTSLMTLGYDPQKKKYVGTWIGSMMTKLWVYEGTVDPSGKTLTLSTEGPSCADGGKTTAKFQDIIEFKSDDHRVLTSDFQDQDGNWQKFMTAHYRRRK